MNIPAIRLASLLLTLACFSVPVAGETYIVPIWSEHVEGSDGVWLSQVIALNPNPFPVRYRVTAALPYPGGRCDECLTPGPQFELPAFGSGPVAPGDFAGRKIDAGAFVINSDTPLVIHSVAYRGGRPEIRQRLDTARGWLAPGRHQISTVERGPRGSSRVNLFLSNPNASVIEVRYRMDCDEERTVTVAPHRTVVVRIERPPCPEIDIFPPPPHALILDSTGEFLASASTIAEGWAVFVLADGARE
jgi:hypothetical protein